MVVFYTKETRFIKTGVVRKTKTYKLVTIDEGQALREIAEKVIPNLQAALVSISSSG